jgi:hypothetical protein
MLNDIIYAIIEIWDYCSSAARRVVTPKMLVGVDEPNAGSTFTKWVVLCCYETTPRPDLLGLLRAFKSHNFGVVIASSNASVQQYTGLADLIIRVAPLGRDFTAYQQAFKHLCSSDRLRDDGSIVFVNDSVWFFSKYHEEIVERINTGISEGALACGTMIVDEVPHVSGWLFGVPTTREFVIELQTLFNRNFARKSRRHHIRQGEHQILPTLKSASGVLNLDLPSSIPAVPQGYTAIMQGSQCYYMKADSSFRVNNARSRMTEFLTTNSSGPERSEALRWLARRSDILCRSRIRQIEMRRYNRAYFP